MKKYSELLSAWCDTTCKMFGWDFEAEEQAYRETGSRRAFADEQIKTAVQKAMGEAYLNPGRGIVALYEFFTNKKNNGWLKFKHIASEEQLTKENIAYFTGYLEHLLVLKEMYESWCNSDLKEALNNFYGKIEPDGAFKFDPAILVSINELVAKKHFKVYKYLDGGDEIYEGDKFNLNNTIPLSTDLASYLALAKGSQEIMEKTKGGNIFVTLFGCIDSIDPLYSNWVFTLHKGKTIWVVTDQLNFDNPYQKKARLSRRSIWDSREQVYEKCDLPYDIFHDLAEERNNTKSLSAYASKVFPLQSDAVYKSSFKDGPDEINLMGDIADILELNGIKFTAMAPIFAGYSYNESLEEIQIRDNGVLIGYWKRPEQRVVIFSAPEIFFRKFDELQYGHKIFCLLLIDEVIEWIKTSGFDIPQAILAKDFIEQKMIEGGSFNPVGNKTKMQYWGEDQKAIFSEILETLEDITGEPQRALAQQSYGMVINAEQYDANALLLVEKQNGLAEWLILNDIAVKIKRGGLRKLESLRAEGEEWLQSTFQENYSEIIQRAFIAHELFFTYGVFSAFSDVKEYGCKCGYIINFKKEDKSVYDFYGKGIGKIKHNKDKCVICGKYDAKKIKTIHIRYYKELMWLLGMDKRELLHPYYRQYRAHNMIPYIGNSRLSQTHPFLSINDPASKGNLNGLYFHAYACGHCKNKLSKNSVERIDIIIDNDWQIK